MEAFPRGSGMRTARFLAAVGVWAGAAWPAPAATRYVSASGSHDSPYTNWATAAHDIQTAVDAAAAGDTILVTNGTYDAGGKAVDSGMTNRVAINKAVTVISVNGPDFTAIVGRPCPTNGANGSGAVRGVYLSGGAVLAGFTVTNGHTLALEDHGSGKTSGGGVYVSGDGLVSNCVLTGNAAYYHGGGAEAALIHRSILDGNRARSGGGGADESDLYNCLVRGNTAQSGGGVIYSRLYNCTLVGNTATNRGGGMAYSYAHSTILADNNAPASSNVYLWSYTNCCLYPATTATGNSITNAPGFVDGEGGDYHLSPTSACINAGLVMPWMAGARDFDLNTRVAGVSVDIGAFEYPVLTDPLAVEIAAEDFLAVAGFAVPLVGRIVGNAQGFVWRFGDGRGATNELFVTNTYAATGLYEVTLTASNLAGTVAATATVEIVAAGCAYYVATNGSDGAAGTNWATAKATIQAAADAAGPGCTIWVTNGVYDRGGRVVYGGLTNRVALDKPLFLRSVNGPEVTFIAGAPNAEGAPDGAAAVRGVYMASNTVLDGFTVTNGHTLAEGDTTRERSGGGVYAGSTNALVTHCVITGSTADRYGAGCYRGTLYNCRLLGNVATNMGGGAYSSVLLECVVADNAAMNGGGFASSPARNCVVRGNRAAQYGGGIYSASGVAESCTVAGNSAGTSGGGAYRGSLLNSIVYYNNAPTGPEFFEGDFTNCCAASMPAGANNITNPPGIVSTLDPRLLPGAAVIGQGTNQAWMAAGVDADGAPRIAGASVDIGAFEFVSELECTGALYAAVSCAYTQAPAGFSVPFEARVTGRAQGYEWDFGDGTRATGGCVVGHAFAAAGIFPVVLTVSNLAGSVAATVSVTIVEADCELFVRPGGSDAAAGTNWATAFATIQAAVDAASLGCTIWVTNGVYASGGRAVEAGLTNRVAVDKVVTVRSVNGPAFTAIVGAGGAGGGAGTGAVRCVWLAAGARLDGFTLTNGFTLATGASEKQGGGAWAEGSLAVLTNCLVAGCGAAGSGGGVYGGTLYSVLLDGNAAARGGGAGSAELTGCTITNNRAGSGGGAEYCTLSDCRISRNSATNGDGGGVYGGTLTGCLLSGNTAWDSGGGAYDAQLTGCILQSNMVTGSTGEGGGAYGGALVDCSLVMNAVTGALSFGGGAASAALSGCMLASNRAAYGGGAYGGTLSNCLARWNAAHYGGGAYDSLLYGGAFHNNTASNGGGLFSGTAYDTVFSNNTAIAGGGGACAATLHRCRLLGNDADEGGGAGGGALYNCVVMGNTADMGGGVASAESYNCTIVNNDATSFGGGTFWGTPRNCIVYYNTAFASVNAYFGWLTNCCSSPMPDGTDNFIAAPKMADYAAGDVRLLSNSPCLNAGTNQDWMAGAREAGGNNRLILNVVDVGAYEYTYPGEDHDGDGIETAYETGTGVYAGPGDTGTDPLLSDTDSDRVGDGDELTAGTDPVDGSSFLGMILPAAQDSAGFVISWQSVAGKFYRLERSTNLTAAFDWVVQSNIPATPALNTVTDTTATGTGPFYYRAGVEP